MPPFLKAKTAGLPRWAWLGIGVGAIGIGLYLRSRSTEEEETPVSEPEGGLAGEYGETDTAGGLAAAGLIGPAQGAVVPVQTPFLPEGLTDIFSTLDDIITNQGAVIESITNTHTEVSGEAITGGGAPEQGGAHTPAPTAACSQNTIAKLHKNKQEIDRLQGEVNTLQAKIQTLTNNIQAHPKANNVNQWKSERTAAQANIQGKRAKIAALSGENGALRKLPGCDKVAA